jgi:quinol monooxygenase YgiN
MYKSNFMKILKPNKMQFSPNKSLSAIITLFTLTLLLSNTTMAQEKIQMVRLAKIKVDPLQLDKYNIALKEQMTTAVRVEPGVLTYYAVADKKDPTLITILEIYADTSAYKSHIETIHFKKYKEIVKDMVKSLELTDVNLIASAKKEGM